MIFFISAIVSFVWRGGPEPEPESKAAEGRRLLEAKMLIPRILISVLLFLGIVYFVLIVRTLKRYSDRVGSGTRGRGRGGVGPVLDRYRREERRERGRERERRPRGRGRREDGVTSSPNLTARMFGSPSPEKREPQSPAPEATGGVQDGDVLNLGSAPAPAADTPTPSGSGSANITVEVEQHIDGDRTPSPSALPTTAGA